MKLSEKIKQARMENNLTQQQLSDEINISRKTLSGWENDRSSPNVELLHDLAKCLNKDVLYFIEDQSEFNEGELATENSLILRRLVSIISLCLNVFFVLVILYVFFK
ncbi:helix-turn-helix domain-containing protein [Fructilactobacillus hinvesii]|uniref:Helix-turn-helix domain-containing protein n=1 Tax=Fructilactobacillus hinvesii TaxID=2940300 RepID=A0ABY5BSV3_9LACO|nr:helix-turn-helix transcriptional regulator [Fructilactobacillus hinvesii]USS88195.1 helix-turn-helix domain-containing protein [Fructilactobacillus hinvesii]